MTAEQFAAAFARMNGYAPSPGQVKDALAYEEIVRSSGLDPYLLQFISDAKTLEQRDRLPEEVRAAVTEGVAEIRGALPSTDELLKRLKYVAALRGSLDVVAGALRNLTIDVGAILTVMVVLLAVGGYFTSRLAYQFGARSNHEACVVLSSTKRLAIQHEHLQTVEDLSAAIAARCR
ncbi:MAG: hypothetical protein ACYDDQ_01745 [Vulcanimicrobiaceae bacterium]